MKYIKFLLIGVLFGITLSKAEVISWFRIYEMFKLQSFHMYGVIGSAVAIGIVVIHFFKNERLKTYQGKPIFVEPKKKGVSRNLLGGIIFGLGWALGGACPGPMYILLGKGVVAILVVLLGAHIGAFLYHGVKHKLPH
mgnify:FL=1|jgi:uncharacterized membrane protein YedE/YeeE